MKTLNWHCSDVFHVYFEYIQHNFHHINLVYILYFEHMVTWLALGALLDDIFSEKEIFKILANSFKMRNRRFDPL